MNGHHLPLIVVQEPPRASRNSSSCRPSIDLEPPRHKPRRRPCAPRAPECPRPRPGSPVARVNWPARDSRAAAKESTTAANRNERRQVNSAIALPRLIVADPAKPPAELPAGCGVGTIRVPRWSGQMSQLGSPEANPDGEPKGGTGADDSRDRSVLMGDHPISLRNSSKR